MKTSTVILMVLVAVILVGGAYWFLQQGSNTQSTSSATSGQNVRPTNAQPISQPTPGPASLPSSAPTQVAVSITNFAFDPATISIKTGGTVTWKNNDSVAHTVTSDAGSFASQTLSPGASYSHTFSSAGTFPYHCAIHPSMHGTVIVQ